MFLFCICFCVIYFSGEILIIDVNYITHYIWKPMSKYQQRPVPNKCYTLHLDKVLAFVAEHSETKYKGHKKEEIIHALEDAAGHLDVNFAVIPDKSYYYIRWQTRHLKDEGHSAHELSWWKALLLLYRHNAECKVTTRQWDMTHHYNQDSHTSQGRKKHVSKKGGMFNMFRHVAAQAGDPFDQFLRHKCMQIAFYLDLPLFKKQLGLKCTMTWDHSSMGDHVFIAFHGSSKGETEIKQNRMREGFIRYLRSSRGILTKHEQSCSSLDPTNNSSNNSSNIDDAVHNVDAVENKQHENRKANNNATIPSGKEANGKKKQDPRTELNRWKAMTNTHHQALSAATGINRNNNDSHPPINPHPRPVNPFHPMNAYPPMHPVNPNMFSQKPPPAGNTGNNRNVDNASAQDLLRNFGNATDRLANKVKEAREFMRRNERKRYHRDFHELFEKIERLGSAHRA